MFHDLDSCVNSNSLSPWDSSTGIKMTAKQYKIGKRLGEYKQNSWISCPWELRFIVKLARLASLLDCKTRNRNLPLPSNIDQGPY